MRKKKFFKQAVFDHPENIFIPSLHEETLKNWIKKRSDGKAIFLEIGIGTGDFLITQAKKYPESFFLGLEAKPDRLYKGFLKSKGLSNIAFLHGKFEIMMDFGLPLCHGIFLLFPDPWPKKRHRSRRLGGAPYLSVYESLLEENGFLLLKTDNRSFFDFTVENLILGNWNIMVLEHDMKTPEDEQTAYERRFVNLGMPIYSLTASKPKER